MYNTFVLLLYELIMYWTDLFSFFLSEILARLHAFYGVLFEWDLCGLPGAPPAGDTQ